MDIIYHIKIEINHMIVANNIAMKKNRVNMIKKIYSPDGNPGGAE